MKIYWKLILLKRNYIKIINSTNQTKYKVIKFIIDNREEKY